MELCQPCHGHSPKPTPESLKSYNDVRILSMVLILSLSVFKCPKFFCTSAVLGLSAETFARSLKIKGYEKFSEKIDEQKQLEASGCLDIVPKVFGLEIDPRISLVSATILFCCHINHSHSLMMKVSVVYVGTISGFASFHFLKDNKYLDIGSI